MTDVTNKNEDSLYIGLQALSTLSFPKQCNTCGRRYETAEQFVGETQNLRNSTGLKEEEDDDGQVIVNLFRNCICGSTLMDEFNNRRNLTADGIKRRHKFSELLDRLTQKGFSADVARKELLKVMRGEGSRLLNVKKNQ